MKKIVSLLMTVAMMISTASAVFAADCTFAITPDKTEATPGEVITFKVDLTGTPGIAYFKNFMTFDGDAFEHEQYFSEDDYDYVNAYSKLGAVTYNETEAGRALFVMSRATDNKNPWIFTVCYKVADDAVNGEYTFTVDDEQVLQASGTQLDVAPATTTITVTGGKEPAPSIVEAKIAANEPIEGEKVVKEDGNTYFTKGLSATLTPGTETVTNVIATFFNKAGNEGKEKAEWAGSYKGETPITFAVNVLNVPDGEDVTATWEIVK